MCEVAFSELVGPFVVPRAGHFLQWERAALFNATADYFLRDLRSAARPVPSDGSGVPRRAAPG
jgi:hypothetical protein